MEVVQTIWDLTLNLDKYMAEWISLYRYWIYVILFFVVLLETGVLPAAFLPGDSLLFVTGTLAAVPANHLNVHLVSFLMICGAILGGILNYFTGRKFGIHILRNPDSGLIRRKHLVETNRFYDTYGSLTLILARFIPFVRTFAPFVAGMGKMNYKRFALYNILGAFVWIILIVYAGYFLGSFTIIQENIPWVILILIILANSPALIGILRRRWKKRQIKKEIGELQ